MDLATYILFTREKNRVKDLNPTLKGGHYVAKCYGIFKVSGT
jgi:hypothetical protein